MFKNTFAFIIALICYQNLIAQNFTQKVILKKGDIIKSTSDMNSSSTQSMGGEAMEMKTTLVSASEMEVKEVLENGYLISVTTKSMKMDFEGFGQKMNYDSENKTAKKEGPMASLDEMINKSEELIIDFKGKYIVDSSKNEEEKKDAKGEKGKKGNGGKGMMKMMGMESGSSVEAAFLIIPENTKPGMSWETKSEKDGLTTRKRFTLDGLIGNVANISVQSQVKGTVETNRGGFAMTNKMNT
ncbi:MAG: hypothetical protein KA275_08800, partial [Chitinophagaceae bacterium]|nr:hypothetical protein [Chitinophagaceae bacterium]